MRTALKATKKLLQVVPERLALAVAAGTQTFGFVSHKYLHSLHFALPFSTEVLIIEI